ncbi:MAG: hypothetical protein J6X21_02795 [Bacteroidaceae bacterium]|nr:hypothetical protein [Bacteroidaceae bacterium]
MRKSLVSAIVATFFASLFLPGCGPVEQSTFTESIYRIGTVYSDQTGTGIIPDKIDGIQEKITLKNFNNPSHLARFGVDPGDRVLATMEFKAEGSAENSTVELLQVNKLKVQSLESRMPSDTLNFYYKFSVSLMGKTSYPAIWNSGHIINVTPVFFIPEYAREPKFYFYPVEVLEDTLVVRLYSLIPDDDVSLNPDYTQTILNCDISTLADPVSDPVEQARRGYMLESLRMLDTDRIQVRVVTPDTLRARNSKNAINPKYVQPVPGLPQTVQIPFDF